MIPYFRYTIIPIGAVHIQVWGLMVSLGIVVALIVACREAKRRGLDQGTMVDLATWIMVPALIMARLVHVFAYDPAPFIADPWKIFKLWEGGMSSFGGFIGAAIGALVFAKIRKIDFEAYADVASYGFPLGYCIGRIGCFLIHDHPGTLSHSLLAVQYPGGARLDHGLLLSMLAFAIFAFFLLIKRQQPNTKEKGYLSLLMILYGLSRFFLDFYRAWDLAGSDVRYFWLTPAQYGSIILVLGGIALHAHFRRRNAAAVVGKR